MTRKDVFAVGLDVLREQATDVLGQIAGVAPLRAAWTAMGIDVPARVAQLTAVTEQADAAWLAADLADRAEKGLGVDRKRIGAEALAWVSDAKACLRLPIQRGSVEIQAAARSVRQCLTVRTSRTTGALAMFRLVQPRLDETEALLTPYYTVRPIVSDARALQARLTVLESRTVALTKQRAGITAAREAATTALRAELRSVADDWRRAQRRDAGVVDLDLTILRTAAG